MIKFKEFITEKMYNYEQSKKWDGGWYGNIQFRNATDAKTLAKILKKAKVKYEYLNKEEIGVDSQHDFDIARKAIDDLEITVRFE